MNSGAYIIICTLILINIQYKDKYKQISWILLGILGIYSFLIISYISNSLNLLFLHPITIYEIILAIYTSITLIAYLIILLLIILKKRILLSQYLSLTLMTLSYGTLLYYILFRTTNFEIIFTILISNLILSIILLLYYPKKGIIRALYINTAGSKFARKIIINIPIIFTILCIIIIYLDMNTGFVIPREIVLTTLTVGTIFIILLYYSKYVSKSDIKRVGQNYSF